MYRIKLANGEFLSCLGNPLSFYHMSVAKEVATDVGGTVEDMRDYNYTI
jgi:hypothetical protein